MQSNIQSVEEHEPRKREGEQDPNAEACVFSVSAKPMEK